MRIRTQVCLDVTPTLGNGLPVIFHDVYTPMSPDRSQALLEAVEIAQAEFSQACEPGVLKEIKQEAALRLEQAVIRLNDYIMRAIIPEVK
jgi:hypothetical protein